MKAWLAFTVCALPVLLGALIPIVVLSKLAISHGDPMLGSGFVRFVWNSVYAASLATMICVAIALLLTYARNIAENKWINRLVGFATLGYALPGAMLAIGLFAPISRLDRWLTGSLEQWIGWDGGLILTGGVGILIYAYVVRFLTVAYNTTSSGLSQIPPVYGQVARSLGATPMRVVREIQMPLMLRSIGVAGHPTAAPVRL
jgi:iron(III) transport system permease protein